MNEEVEGCILQGVRAGLGLGLIPEKSEHHLQHINLGQVALYSEHESHLFQKHASPNPVEFVALTPRLCISKQNW
jgi:hypothetical protein